MTIRKIIKDLQEARLLNNNQDAFEAGFDCAERIALTRLRTLESDILRILNGEKGQSRSTQVLLDVLGQED